MTKTLTRTLYPELVDANVANSTEFLNQYSNYLTAVGAIADELGDFIDETNASIDYRNALKYLREDPDFKGDITKFNTRKEIIDERMRLNNFRT